MGKYTNDDEPHVVVVTGISGKKQTRFANVIGPFDNKRLASNWAKRSRGRTRKNPWERQYVEKIQGRYHIRPMFDPEEIEKNEKAFGF